MRDKGKRLAYFDDNTEALTARIATGLHKVGLALKQQAWEAARDEELTAIQRQVLAALLVHGPLTEPELSDRLGVALPTVRESVRGLVESELITLSARPPPRARLLTPTRRGADLGVRALSWPEFMADAVAGLSLDEQRTLFSCIVKMIRTLQAQGLIPLSGMCVTCTHFRPNVHAGASPHHCAFVDAPLAEDQLRLDCPDHERAVATAQQVLWEQFIGIGDLPAQRATRTGS